MTHKYKKLPVTMKMWMQFNVMPWTSVSVPMQFNIMPRTRYWRRQSGKIHRGMGGQQNEIHRTHDKAVAKSNQLFGHIYKTILYRDGPVIKRLYLV